MRTTDDGRRTTTTTTRFCRIRQSISELFLIAVRQYLHELQLLHQQHPPLKPPC